MPDAALKATERQFVTLLGATAGNLDVRLSFYALPEFREPTGAAAMWKAPTRRSTRSGRAVWTA